MLVDARQSFRIHHFPRRSVSHDPPLLHQQKVRAELRGQVEIVRRENHGDPVLPVQLHDQFHQVPRVLDIEMRRRLVQKEYPRFLRERHGHNRTLFLTRAQFVDQPVLQARTSVISIALRIAASSSRDSRDQPETYGVRPIATNSATVKATGTSSVCGTNPTICASSRRAKRANVLAVNQQAAG